MNGAYRGRDAPPTSIKDKSPNSIGTETLSVQLRKSYLIIIVDLRINETRQTGAVGNRTYRVWGKYRITRLIS